MKMNKNTAGVRALAAPVAGALLFCVAADAFAERKIFTFSAETTSANLAEGKEFTKLSGDAEVTADDVKINGDEIQLYGDDFQYAEVLGGFTAYDMKNDFLLEGNSLLYDRRQKLLRAEGNIVMKDNRNDVVIRANFLESKEDGKFMVVQLGVRITKKDELSARSEFVTYFRDTDELQMSGFPYVLWKDDEYSANRITINLDTDEVQLVGDVSGSISTASADDDSDADGVGGAKHEPVDERSDTEATAQREQADDQLNERPHGQSDDVDITSAQQQNQNTPEKKDIAEQIKQPEDTNIPTDVNDASEQPLEEPQPTEQK